MSLLRRAYNVVTMPAKLGRLPIEFGQARAAANDVEQHWTRHTIAGSSIYSPQQSIAYIKEIDRLYPFYFKYCDLYGEHEGEVVIDYGCGPGNDLVGYFLYSKARQIIGVDISLTALQQARFRLALHGATGKRVRLIKKSESDPRIPLLDASADYVQSLGVIHHVSQPLATLKELYRVLKPGGTARVMVYNHDSLYLHLSIPYEMQIQQGQYPGLTAYQAYQKFGDAGAPVVLCYRPDEFLDLARTAGFHAEYVGAAFSESELVSWRQNGMAAKVHPALPEEHRRFLMDLVEDKFGFPTYRGHHAGLDAVFTLQRR